MAGRKALYSVLLAIVYVLIASPASAAEAFPASPIRIVVGYAPGGTNDLMARVFAKHLSEVLGKPVLVDNRPGAATIVSAQAVAKSSPDGYMLMLADRPLVTNPYIYSNAGYDPIKDFEPVALLGTAAVLLVTYPQAEFKTVGDLVSYAKSRPGEVTMASSGAGSTTHIAGELFQLLTNIRLNHVPYKGAGPALTDVMGGRVHLMFAPAGSVMPLIGSGKLRALAITSSKRDPALPNVATFEEAGVKDYKVSNWYGLFAPAGTPATVLAALRKAIANVMQIPEVKTWYERSLVAPESATPEQFAAFLRAEAATWSHVIKTKGIKAD